MSNSHKSPRLPFRELILSCLLLISVTSSGEEGLHLLDRAAPQSVRTAVGSVFAIFTHTQDGFHLGSAFVVANERGDRSQVVTLLTARHVVREFCTLNSPCRNLVAARDLRLVIEGFTEMSFSQHDVMKNLVLVAESEELDLALMRVEVKKSFRVVPLKFNESLAVGQRVYPIGFPRAYLRETLNQAGLIAKRWSTGVINSFLQITAGSLYRQSADTGGRALFGTSADSLNGNSGGPVLNANGEFIGVVTRSASVDENSNGYFGPDETNHTAAVFGERLRQFLLSRGGGSL